MKTYLYVDVPWTATGSIEVRAPFDGTVIESVESEYPLGTWVRVLHRSGWVFTAFHVDPVVKDGTKVTAGQRIAAFPPANASAVIPARMGEPQANFDFSLEAPDGRKSPLLSAFSADLAASWSARGFVPASAVISKAARDSAPCPASYPEGPDSPGFLRATP